MNLVLLIICICGAIYSEDSLFSGWVVGKKPEGIHNESVGFKCSKCGRFIGHSENDCPMQNHTHRDEG
ncbi:hypothetical protein LCGC14_0434810 [marine sediment metagenome]|uniref:Uncharacterized protein n=1 Tax=marine sediment metagenome TaxID=412755 RepID=A0A0F9ST88_9ZZZZ